MLSSCVWGGDWVFDVNSLGPKYVFQGAGLSLWWRRYFCGAVRYIDEDSRRGLVKVLISFLTFRPAVVSFFKDGYREMKQRLRLHTDLFSNSICGSRKNTHALTSHPDYFLPTSCCYWGCPVNYTSSVSGIHDSYKINFDTYNPTSLAQQAQDPTPSRTPSQLSPGSYSTSWLS